MSLIKITALGDTTVSAYSTEFKIKPYMAITYPDAEIVWSGHTHTEFYLSIARIRLNFTDVVERDEQIHLRSPGYKEDTAKGEGWAVEKGFMPQSLGAWWLKVWLECERPSYKIRYSVEPAK